MAMHNIVSSTGAGLFCGMLLFLGSALQLAVAQPMQPDVVNMFNPIDPAAPVATVVNCSETFSLISNELPNHYFRLDRGNTLKRNAESLSEKKTHFRFVCIKQQQPDTGILRYGDTVQLASAHRHLRLTSTTVDGTLTFGPNTTSVDIVLASPTELDTNGPLKEAVALKRKSDGAWLSLVLEDDTSVIWMNGARDDKMSHFRVINHRPLPLVFPTAAERKNESTGASGSDAGSNAATGAATARPVGRIPGPPTDLRYVQLTSTSAEFSWSEPADKGDSPITAYRLERCDDVDCNSNRLVVQEKNVLSAISTDNTIDKEYFFRARALNAAGLGEPTKPLSVFFLNKDKNNNNNNNNGGTNTPSQQASQAEDKTPEFCKKFCSNDCGFTCRKSCPSMCETQETAPSALCKAQCSVGCTVECTASCPTMCPEQTAKVFPDAKVQLVALGELEDIQK